MENKVKSNKIFLENAYDIETIFDALKIATAHNKELLYMDKLIATLRVNPKGDTTAISFNILEQLDLISL